jgi:hypothetical protein
MKNALKSLPAYYKAVVAGLGGVASTGTAVLGLGDVLPHAVSGWLTGALAVITATSVFLVKNEAVVVPPVTPPKA